MTKFFKAVLIIIASLLAIFLAFLFAFIIVTKDAKLDESKLINPEHSAIIYDNDGNEVVGASLSGKNKNVAIESLSNDTINAFIASEDRTFFTNNGLNYKRMLKALYRNVTSRSFKEGASTISQQLIKNTHLSGDKTIKRKLNEIKLAKQLEKRYSKKRILEMYLNTIYFGHNCYGLESAAEFYFDKKAEDLTLEESATVVGLLTSPNNFSPFKNPEKCLKRRNTVLKAMKDCGYIDENKYESATASPIITHKSNAAGKISDYIGAIFDELEETDYSAYELTSGTKIYTYLDVNLQNAIENIDFPCDNSVIVTSENGVCAYKSTIGAAKRQPGSTVKPFIVYAPAIEEKLLSPCTKILDEKINYGGYSPENHDKNYHGYVTCADSIKYSYNIPAVKTLNSLTIKKAEKYLTDMNLKLDDDEKNLSLALGGMKYGLSLKEIADRYSIFSAKGIYSPSRFIKKIESADGKTLYEREYSQSRVFSEGTCSLMNDILIETSKSGTGKKLRDLKYDVAVKTGTCGNADGNTDAYAICYTGGHTVGVWLGDANNKRLNVTGGGTSCIYAKQILNTIYSDGKPQKLDTQSGTVTLNIDAEEYFLNNKIIKADPISPKLNLMEQKFLAGNEPKQSSDRFSRPSITTPQISVKDGTVNIELCQTKYYAYLIKRINNGNFEVIFDGKWQKNIYDRPQEGIYTYSVTPYFESEDKKIYGNEISLPQVNLNSGEKSPQIKIPDIVQKDWFNL